MAKTFTPNAFLQKPATADRNWDVPINANADFLDGVAAIGLLVVTPTEIPSATLNVRVTGGSYVKADGTVGVFPGVASYALPASLTAYLWLTDSGVLSASSAFPATAHVRLAHVVTGPASVQAVVDERVGSKTCGSGLGFVLKGGDTMTGTLSVVSAGSGTAALVVNPTGPAVGFFGAAPASQAAAVAPVVDNSTGTASNTLVDVGSTFSQAQIDANFATLAAKVNALIAAMKRHGLMSN
jgi:hypothetical protein